MKRNIQLENITQKELDAILEALDNHERILKQVHDACVMMVYTGIKAPENSVNWHWKNAGYYIMEETFRK